MLDFEKTSAVMLCREEARARILFTLAHPSNLF